MASGASYKQFWVSAAVICLSAVLLWFGTGLTPYWPLLWFAPLPVLIYALNAGRWCTVLTAFFAWFIGSLNLWDYYHRLLHAPIGAAASITVVPALVFVLAVMLYRALAQRGAYWGALIAFPALWVAFEYSVSLVSPHGTAGSLAYSQLDFLPLLQLASLTGPWGMSFVVLLFPSVAALVLHLYGRAASYALRLGAAGFALIAAVLMFGAVRLAMPAAGLYVRVGLITSDARENVEVADEGAATAALLTAYAASIEKLVAQGAKVIVMPEKLGVAVDHEAEVLDATLQAFADRHKIEIVGGMIHVAPPRKWNEARIYSPGTAVQSYDKEHLLPPFESKFSRGTKLTLLHEPSGTWGLAICKDMDFAQPSRAYGAAGVGLMLVPAWDFDSDRWWHGHLAIMRGVESGFAIARAAKQGYLTVTDTRGRVLAETRSDAGAFATLVADVSTRHDATVYVLLGDWFAWVAVAVATLSLMRVDLFNDLAEYKKRHPNE